MKRTHTPAKAAPPPHRPIVELTIDAVGGHGDGVATHDGCKVFVPQAAPGDRVRAALGEAVRGIAHAEVAELLAPGYGRADPACPHFGPCGGCLVQHLAPGILSDWKRGHVVEALARQDLGDTPVDAPVPVPARSRRRVTVTARRGDRRVFLGFNERASHRIVDVADCTVARPEIVAVLPPLRDLLGGILRPREACDIAITVLDDGLDLVLIGGAEPDLARREALSGFAEVADLARVSWRAAPGRPPEPVAHRRAGTIRLGGVPVVLPPGGFLQASAEAEAAMAAIIAAAAPGAGDAADLFCGVGTFALGLAGSATVTAVDGDGEAIAALTAAVRQSDLAGRLRPRCRNLYGDPLTAAELAGFDLVVFDPPRPGARDQAAQLAASRVPVVAGLSCNPVSFARDARILTSGGYRLERVTPVDQFLWSAHVELVGIFRR